MVVVQDEWADGIACRKCWAERGCERNAAHKVSRLDTAQQSRLAGTRRQSWLSVNVGIPSSLPAN